MIQLLELGPSVEDTSVVSGLGPRLVVCSREGLGQQLLHVEGTLTAISRTDATGIKHLSPSNPTFTLSVIRNKQVHFSPGILYVSLLHAAFIDWSFTLKNVMSL